MSIKVGTCGTFDYVLHPGHIKLLEFAASLGDELYVFIVSDEVVIRNKGYKPYFSQIERCRNMLSRGYNPMPLLGTFQDNLDLITNFDLGVYVFGIDQLTLFDIELEKRLREKLVRIERESFAKEYSTTELLKRIGYV